MAITIRLFYGLCTLVWVLAPGPFSDFMDNLIHGVDFTGLITPRPFA